MSTEQAPDYASRVPVDDGPAQEYLRILETGPDEEKIGARAGLARLFEDRGMLSEASDLLEENVGAGVRDRAVHLQLASLYRRQGSFDLADKALADSVYSHPWDTAVVVKDEPEDPRPAPLVAETAPAVRHTRGRGGALLWVPLAALLLCGTAAAAFALGGPSLLTQGGAGGSSSTAQTALLVQPTPAPADGSGAPSPDADAAASPSAQSGACTFEMGFGDLQRAVGAEAVGECVDDQSYTENGDARQRTTRGELIWRKEDNRSAFTNGSETWIAGPNGVQPRPNDERFAWEPDGPRTARSSPPISRPAVLPGAVLPNRRIVSYYGNTLSKQMGILGEIPEQEMLQRLKQQADAYAKADPSKPVQAALEFIAIVAQEGAGADGMYRLKMDTDVIEEVAQWAEANNMLLILDIQIGWSKIGPEIRSLMPFLRRPYVHLALDPEFAMRPGELPGEAIGTHDAADVNEAIDILSEVVAAENLPPKMLIVHRFTERMLTNYRDIKGDPRVQVVIVMDGFGGPHLKTDHYNAYVSNQPVQYGGFKLFYKQDKPLMTPTEVVDLDPSPDLIIYQ